MSDIIDHAGLSVTDFDAALKFYTAALGRLCLQGAVSEAQWQAGEDWLKLVNARYAATNAPRGFKSAGSSALAIDEDAAIAIAAIITWWC